MMLEENQNLRHMHLQKEGGPGKKDKYVELAEGCEEMRGNCSSLAKDCMELKKKENNIFENYINACQEKEKVSVDSKLEISHQRIKIKLLQETLTKRNHEYESLKSKNKQLVTKYK
jgi:predicted RNase H-like nuclease (RuvC/YqgF family)